MPDSFKLVINWNEVPESDKNIPFDYLKRNLPNSDYAPHEEVMEIVDSVVHDYKNSIEKLKSA